MTERRFVEEVAGTLGCDPQSAESVNFVVFQELRHRLTANEAADVASQLPTGLKRLWTAGAGERGESSDRPVKKIHRAELIGRVRQRAVLPDDGEAERGVRAVFPRCSGCSAARVGAKARRGTCSASSPRT